MRLTVLGGSAAGVGSGVGCSGYLVDGGGRRVVLDLGPGTLPELRRHADFRRLDAVVVSHLHLDHLLDLLALRFALAYNPVPPPRPIALWLPPGGLAFLERAARVFAEPDEVAGWFDGAFVSREYDPDQRLELDGLSIGFAPTVHFVPCWAMRVRAADAEGDLVYTADTGPTAELGAFAAGTTIVVAEATEAGREVPAKEGRGHLTPEEAAAIAREAGASVLLLAHLWEEHGKESARDRAGAVFGGRVEVARPGLTIEW